MPCALRSALEEELSHLVEADIISPVVYSQWTAPIVVIKKGNDKIRVCADSLMGLNAAIDIHQFPLPTPDDIFATLDGEAFFSHPGLSNAYLQIGVNEPSKQLLVINTNLGLFQYNRLPFGVNSALTIFQQVMSQTISGIPGVVTYLDGILVSAKTRGEHLQRLRAVLLRLKPFGFCQRNKKCTFLAKSVKYLGFILDLKGISPDPDKVAAIKQMLIPTNLMSLRSYLGFVNYYAKFVLQIYKLRAPLEKLLHKTPNFDGQ